MADSDFVYLDGEPVDVGNAVENDFVFVENDLLSDADVSDFAFIEGRGLGDGGEGIIDDFERGNMDPYEEISVAGSYEVTGTDVYGGSHSLSFSTTSGSGGRVRVWSDEGAGLQNYPTQGDVWEYRIKFDSTTITGTEQTFCAGGEDGTKVSSGYRVITDVLGSEFGVRNITGSEVTTSFSFQTGVWYKVTIDFSDAGELVVAITDPSGSQTEQLTLTDISRTEGGVGWRFNTDSTTSGSAHIDECLFV